MMLSQLFKGLWSKESYGLTSTASTLLQSSQLLPKPCCAAVNQFHTSPCDLRARLGTKFRRDAIHKAQKKIKLEREAKLALIPEHLRPGSRKSRKPSKRTSLYPNMPPPPADDVYCTSLFQPKMYSCVEAVESHRETHHPTQYNFPDAPVYVKLELNLMTNKQYRYLDTIRSVVALPNKFPMPEKRRIAAITDCEETRDKLLSMEVPLVAGKEVVKLVKSGEVDMTEFDYVVSSLDILPDLLPVRGLMKTNFPNTKQGTAVHNVVDAVDKFMSGLEYESHRDNYELDYGEIITQVGDLTMTNEQVMENVMALLQDVEKQRSSRKSDSLITIVVMSCPPTKELLLVNHHELLNGDKKGGEEKGKKNQDKQAIN